MLTRIALYCAAIIALNACPFVSQLAVAQKPAMAWSHRGIALGLFAEARDFDYGPLLDEIAQTGATHVSLVIPYYQHSVRSVQISAHPRFSPSDATVIRTMQQARRRGLAVLLFPILRLQYTVSSDEWRGTIRPKDATLWWRSYNAFVVKFAKMAQQCGAAAFSVGSELESMDTDPAPWKTLVAQVRRVFDGALIYAANWHQLERTAVLDLVDVVGVSAYFRVVGWHERNPSFDRLLHGWRACRARVTRWWARIKKPLVFTELGYRSVEGTASDPWEESIDVPLSLRAQTDAYRAFARVWRDADFLKGVYVWNWFGWGGPKSREFTPRGKPAAREICRWYGVAPDTCPKKFGLMSKRSN